MFDYEVGIDPRNQEYFRYHGNSLSHEGFGVIGLPVIGPEQTLNQDGGVIYSDQASQEVSQVAPTEPLIS